MGKTIKVRRSRRVAYKSSMREEFNEEVMHAPRNTQKVKLHSDWKSNGVMVSDHAVVRYLEYAYGFNINLVREEMMAQGRADIIRRILNGKVPCGDGCRLVARNGVVVTVVKPRKQYKRNGA